MPENTSPNQNARMPCLLWRTLTRILSGRFETSALAPKSLQSTSWGDGITYWCPFRKERVCIFYKWQALNISAWQALLSLSCMKYSVLHSQQQMQKATSRWMRQLICPLSTLLTPDQVIYHVPALLPISTECLQHCCESCMFPWQT